MANPGQMNNQYSQAVYDQPNCDYDPAKNFQNQNFGNPYDCPENMYGGSMMSSVGYSQVNCKTKSFFSQVFKKVHVRVSTTCRITVMENSL